MTTPTGSRSRPAKPHCAVERDVRVASRSIGENRADANRADRAVGSSADRARSTGSTDRPSGGAIAGEQGVGAFRACPGEDDGEIEAHRAPIDLLSEAICASIGRPTPLRSAGADVQAWGGRAAASCEDERRPGNFRHHCPATICSGWQRPRESQPAVAAQTRRQSGDAFRHVDHSGAIDATTGPRSVGTILSAATGASRARCYETSLLGRRNIDQNRPPGAECSTQSAEQAEPTAFASATTTGRDPGQPTGGRSPAGPSSAAILGRARPAAMANGGHRQPGAQRAQRRSRSRRFRLSRWRNRGSVALTMASRQRPAPQPMAQAPPARAFGRCRHRRAALLRVPRPRGQPAPTRRDGQQPNRPASASRQRLDRAVGGERQETGRDIGDHRGAAAPIARPIAIATSQSPRPRARASP